MESVMSGDMQALTLVVDGVHMDICSTSSGMEKLVSDHGSDRGDARLESFFVLSREAIKVVRPRWEELLTLVKDAVEHEYPEDQDGVPRFMQDLMEKVCDVFKLERVRVCVRVIGDGEETSRSVKRDRHQEVLRVLNSQVWPPTNVEEQIEGEDLDDVRLRADEIGAFQCALMAKYLWKLLMRTFPYSPRLDLLSASVAYNGLQRILDDQSREFNWTSRLIGL
ncbi:hypothetical protein NCS52_01589400 [Fusarium sp. LHS14.1]|nr:hypothetical protein NCS52_01589400 [Fusarium sp. LHS14.1]